MALLSLRSAAMIYWLRNYHTSFPTSDGNVLQSLDHSHHLQTQGETHVLIENLNVYIFLFTQLAN